jgi:hypothetical protein
MAYRARDAIYGVAHMPQRPPDWRDPITGAPRWNGLQHPTHLRARVAAGIAQGRALGAISQEVGLSVRQVTFLGTQIARHGTHLPQGHGVHGNHATKFEDRHCDWLKRRLMDPRAGGGRRTGQQMCDDLYMHWAVRMTPEGLRLALDRRYNISWKRLTQMNKAAFTLQNIERTRLVRPCSRLARPACECFSSAHTLRCVA